MNHVARIAQSGCVVATVALLGFSMAAASPWCPTKSEARDRYPDAHLFWHSDLRCWDNRHANSRDWPHRRMAREEALPGRTSPRAGLPDTLPGAFPGWQGEFPGGPGERALQGLSNRLLPGMQALPVGFPRWAATGVPLEADTPLRPPLTWADRWPTAELSAGKSPEKRKMKRGKPESEHAIAITLLTMALVLAIIEVLFGDWIVKIWKRNISFLKRREK